MLTVVTTLLRRLLAAPPGRGAATQAATLLEQLPEVVFRTDAEGRWRFLSAGWQRLTGFGVDDSLGAAAAEFLHPRDRERWRVAADDLLHARLTEVGGLLRLLGEDGESRWLELRARAARGEDGRPDGVLGTLANVTTRVQEEELLQASHRTLRGLIDEVPGMIYRCRNNPHWTMEYVSGGAAELTGYRPEDLVDNRTVSYASLIHPEDQQQVWNHVQSAVRDRQGFDLVYRILTRDGQQKWVWERGKGVLSASGELLGLEGFMTDITLAERRRRSQRRDALYDPLTMLPVEALFRDRLQRAVQRARTPAGSGFALLEVRVDRFARLRSRFGDDLVERVLLDVGRRLTLALDEADSLTRLAEDRFALLVERRCEVGEVYALASRLREQLRTPIAVGDSSLYVSASIGIAHSDTGYRGADEVLRDADTAVSRAHAQGGGRHELFDAHLHARAAALHAHEQALHAALTAGELSLLPRRVAGLEDDLTHGWRMTLAWKHQRRGRLLADDFLESVVDETLLDGVRTRLLELAAEAIREAAPGAGELLCLDLPHRLLDGRVMAALAETASRSIAGAPLLVGLDERGVARVAGELAAQVARLPSAGPSLLLAPFDFDRHALQVLRRLPVRVVGMAPAQYADGELARALVALAHRFGARVLATGVDDESRLEQARAAACDLHEGALADSPAQTGAEGRRDAFEGDG